MNIAIFGGTFDPIHFGHLRIAEAAREQFHLDRVIFLPSGIPPLKHPAAASAQARLSMVRLAIQGHPQFRVSHWDARQKRTVYTTEALAHFQKQYPRARLFFIVGADALRQLPQWRDGVALLQRCQFLVAARSTAPRIAPALKRHVKWIRMPLHDVASRHLRSAIAQGRSVRYQIPDTVRRFIAKHRLYARASA